MKFFNKDKIITVKKGDSYHFIKYRYLQGKKQILFEGNGIIERKGDAGLKIKTVIQNPGIFLFDEYQTTWVMTQVQN